MELNKDIKNLEQLFHTDLHQYLLSIGKWTSVCLRLPTSRNCGRKSARAICPTG